MGGWKHKYLDKTLYMWYNVFTIKIKEDRNVIRMKGITKLIINEYAMTNMDWMGYTLKKGDIFTYHHTIVLKKDGGLETRDNGSILCGNTSHPYLHLIQCKDKERYDYITAVLIQINQQGYMPTKSQLLAIDEILLDFENKFDGLKNSKGKLLIKDNYKERTQISLRK